MKISYFLRWDKDTGTAYRQTFRITDEENEKLFNGIFKSGVNYGNAHTGNFITNIISKIPEYQTQIKRIKVANSVVYVGNGNIPIY